MIGKHGSANPVPGHGKNGCLTVIAPVAWGHKPFGFCLVTAVMEVAVVAAAGTMAGKLLTRHRGKGR